MRSTIWRGQKIPDIVGNIRVDQAWGSAQIMGGLHQVGSPLLCRRYTGLRKLRQQTRTTTCDHPTDEWGWGSRWRSDPEDAVGCQGHAVRRHRIFEGRCRLRGLWQTRRRTSSTKQRYLRIGCGSLTALFVTGSGLELTKAWGGSLAFEHYWTPSLRTSFVGAFLNVSYSDQAKAMIAATGGWRTCGGLRDCRDELQPGLLPVARVVAHHVEPGTQPRRRC